MTDSRDLALLLLNFPAYKTNSGAVAEILATSEPEIQEEWRSWVAREILPEQDDY